MMINRILERLDVIRKNVKTDEDLEWNRAVYRCSEIIKEESQNSGWIPCSERLPNAEVDVLACDMYGRLWLANWFDYWGWCDITGENRIAVIAWMPLPEPYKEVE